MRSLSYSITRLSTLCNRSFFFNCSNFGPVQEVRIPSQVKRMFGFVTFVYPETAALVLTKTNPHFICGAQVLVKPYRLKPMLVDRYLTASLERINLLVCSSHFSVLARIGMSNGLFSKKFCKCVSNCVHNCRICDIDSAQLCRSLILFAFVVFLVM